MRIIYDAKERPGVAAESYQSSVYPVITHFFLVAPALYMYVVKSDLISAFYDGPGLYGEKFD